MSVVNDASNEVICCCRDRRSLSTMFSTVVVSRLPFAIETTAAESKPAGMNPRIVAESSP